MLREFGCPQAQGVLAQPGAPHAASQGAKVTPLKRRTSAAYSMVSGAISAGWWIESLPGVAVARPSRAYWTVARRSLGIGAPPALPALAPLL